MRDLHARPITSRDQHLIMTCDPILRALKSCYGLLDKLAQTETQTHEKNKLDFQFEYCSWLSSTK